jgi:probable HAF family extracellular repeat protein
LVDVVLTAPFALMANWSLEASEPFFTGLGDLPGGPTRSVAHGISADGTTVVGDSNAADGQHAYVWTKVNGMQDLGLGAALDVSADGSVIAGLGSGSFRWTERTGRTYLDSSARWIYGMGISDDGSVIAGTREEIPGAFRWTQESGSIPLGSLFLNRDNYAADVSDDGQVIVGSQDPGGGQIPFRWTESTGLQLLPVLPGGGHSVAYGTNADGSVLAGRSGGQAFRWTAADGTVGLGDLPGGEFSSQAFSVSADGSRVIGDSSTNDGFEAFIWDAVNGMRNLKLVLTGAGLDLTGWRLTVAWGVSADGMTFAGTGINPQGNEEAWIASISRMPIPEPTTFVLLLILAAATACLRRHRNS